VTPEPTRKLLLCQWFGPLPQWFDLWRENIRRLEPHGYDVLLDTDIDEFAERVHRFLGIEFPREDGRKVCDYRAAFGVLYADEIKGYDFWGHTDLDMLYGRVERWVTEAFLAGLDLHSNHPTYVSGPWSLYRNTHQINLLYNHDPSWRVNMENPHTTG